MAKALGRAKRKQYFADLPEKLRTNVLRGAVREMAKVVQADAKERVTSDRVRPTIKVDTRIEGQLVIGRVRVTAKGFVRSLAWWLEEGTDQHFIRVDDGQRGGKTTRALNDEMKEAGDAASLVIGGKFVGETVLHPGAQPKPFIRVAFDLKQGEAITAGQATITAKVKVSGTPDEGDGDSA